MAGVRTGKAFSILSLVLYSLECERAVAIILAFWRAGIGLRVLA